jgi:hypothetical protein
MHLVDVVPGYWKVPFFSPMGFLVSGEISTGGPVIERHEWLPRVYYSGLESYCLGQQFGPG